MSSRLDRKTIRTTATARERATATESAVVGTRAIRNGKIEDLTNRGTGRDGLRST
jgi:hypothetical protein